MDTTTKLLRVFLLDKQIRSLTSSLRAAERFLAEQEKQVSDLTARAAAVDGQTRQIRAVIAERELEIRSVDENIEQHRERMNTAQTNKEYQALLNEVNTLKGRKAGLESETLELMGKMEELAEMSAELRETIGERTKMRVVAQTQRDEREAEIKDKLEELRGDRAKAAEEPPAVVLEKYDERWRRFDDPDEVMAPIEEQDRKRSEYTCGACMMSIPIESVSALLSHGEVTSCVSCGVILYLEAEVQEALRAIGAKAKARKEATTS